MCTGFLKIVLLIPIVFTGSEIFGQMPNFDQIYQFLLFLWTMIDAIIVTFYLIILVSSVGWKYETFRMAAKFCFRNFNVVGFDLDMTICRYKTQPFMNMMYRWNINISKFNQTKIFKNITHWPWCSEPRAPNNVFIRDFLKWPIAFFKNILLWGNRLRRHRTC